MVFCIQSSLSASSLLLLIPAELLSLSLMTFPYLIVGLIFITLLFTILFIILLLNCTTFSSLLPFLEASVRLYGSLLLASLTVFIFPPLFDVSKTTILIHYSSSRGVLMISLCFDCLFTVSVLLWGSTLLVLTPLNWTWLFLPYTIVRKICIITWEGMEEEEREREGQNWGHKCLVLKETCNIILAEIDLDLPFCLCVAVLYSSSTQQFCSHFYLTV